MVLLVVVQEMVAGEATARDAVGFKRLADSGIPRNGRGCQWILHRVFPCVGLGCVAIQGGDDAGHVGLGWVHDLISSRAQDPCHSQRRP